MGQGVRAGPPSRHRLHAQRQDALQCSTSDEDSSSPRRQDADRQEGAAGLPAPSLQGQALAQCQTWQEAAEQDGKRFTRDVNPSV